MPRAIWAVHRPTRKGRGMPLEPHAEPRPLQSRTCSPGEESRQESGCPQGLPYVLRTDTLEPPSHEGAREPTARGESAPAATPRRPDPRRSRGELPSGYVQGPAAPESAPES